MSCEIYFNSELTEIIGKNTILGCFFKQLQPPVFIFKHDNLQPSIAHS